MAFKYSKLIDNAFVKIESKALATSYPFPVVGTEWYYLKSSSNPNYSHHSINFGKFSLKF